ncbi:IS21 family transposase, partial [Bacillus infantis]
KALNILSTLRNIASRRTSAELEEAAKTLLEISSNPTVAVYKSILERQKKKQKNKARIHETQTEDYGFVRGAEYFGRNGQ